MSNKPLRSAREQQRLQRKLDEALAYLAQHQRAFDRYADDPMWGSSVRRQNDRSPWPEEHHPGLHSLLDGDG